MQSNILQPEEIQTAFPPKIDRAPTTPWYRAGLAAVVFTLILLQLLYFALVAIVATATIWYTAALPVLFATISINWVTIVLLLGPPVIGAITTFFLFKPILARAPKAEEPMQLTREQQPELFEFVDRLCMCVGSPAPASIAVDLQVNASAGLRRGFRSLFSNDLKLTIGLPLVEGLTLRQFAGVLAHEFGHFSQKAGLRSYFLIQSINRWFARVVYDRDAWDMKLDEWRESSSSWRIKLVLWVANLTIRFSRWILHLLLKAGALVSSAFSRQMEYDADYYEATLVGADTFEATTFALPVLSLASAHSWNQVRQGWQVRRLTENFPHMVAWHCRTMSDETLAVLREQTEQEQTERFASHPSAPDRIASVRRRGPLGTFSLEGAATRLFRDFDGLCRSVTLHHYRGALGDVVQTAELLPAEALLSDVARAAEYQQARQRKFGEVSYLNRWLDLDSLEEAPLRRDLNTEEISREYGNTLTRLLHQEGAVGLLEAGTKIQPSAFQVSSSNLEAALQNCEQTRRELDTIARRLLQQVATEIDEIRDAALRSRAGSFPDDPEVDGTRCLTAFQSIYRVQDSMLEMRTQIVRLRILASNRAHVASKEYEPAVERHIRRIDELYREVVGDLEEVPSPIRRGGQLVSLGQQLSHDDPAAEIEEKAGWLLDHADAISLRILDRLCWLAERRAMPANGD